jgi:hypothetical protein
VDDVRTRPVWLAVLATVLGIALLGAGWLVMRPSADGIGEVPAPISVPAPTAVPSPSVPPPDPTPPPPGPTDVVAPPPVDDDGDDDGEDDGDTDGPDDVDDDGED